MRLIDADALEKRLEHLWNISDDSDFANKEVWHALSEAPTIDAVPVVRCKDCKHWKGIPSSNFLEWCNYRVMKTMAEFYCATGERREDGG